jgi:hypothetical protein
VQVEAQEPQEALLEEQAAVQEQQEVSLEGPVVG